MFVMGSANLSLCLYFALYNAAYASNYLLALFMGNLFLYLNYYVFMKLYCGERPTWTCLAYAALLHLTSIPSLYFFLQVLKHLRLSGSIFLYVLQKLDRNARKKFSN